MRRVGSGSISHGELGAGRGGSGTLVFWAGQLRAAEPAVIAGDERRVGDLGGAGGVDQEKGPFGKGNGVDDRGPDRVPGRARLDNRHRHLRHRVVDRKHGAEGVIEKLRVVLCGNQHTLAILEIDSM